MLPCIAILSTCEKQPALAGQVHPGDPPGAGTRGNTLGNTAATITTYTPSGNTPADTTLQVLLKVLMVTLKVAHKGKLKVPPKVTFPTITTACSLYPLCAAISQRMLPEGRAKRRRWPEPKPAMRTPWEEALGQ